MPIFLGTGDGPPVPVAIPGAASAHVWDGVWRQVWSAFTLQPDVIMTWSTAGSHTLTLPAYQCEVDILVVGGGGGGRGGPNSASGGLGGIQVSTIAHDGGGSVPVVIGAGGRGGEYSVNGSAGGASSILGVSAAGGAGGAQSGGAAEKRHSTSHVAHGVSHNLHPYGWGGASVTTGNGKAGGPGFVWVRIRDMRTGGGGTPPSGGRYAWSGSSGRVPESGNLPSGLTPLITHTVTAPGTTTANANVTFDYEWPDVEATIELTKNGAVIGTRVPDLTPTQSLTVKDVTVVAGDIIQLRINSATEWGAWYPVLSSSLTLA